MAGVLCHGNGRPWQFWRAQVPTSLVNKWLADGVQHPIMQCELLAAAVSLAVWGPVLSSSHLTLWIDNDAARRSIVASQAYPQSNWLIVQGCLCAEVDYIWVARVPSVSNPADAPSRGEIPAFVQSASEIKVEVGMIWRLAESLSTKESGAGTSRPATAACKASTGQLVPSGCTVHRSSGSIADT